MKHIQPSESLANGLLLAFAGGMMDAYTYLCRGQVFANAETGNLVLLGIQLAQRNWGRALYYLWPIMSFALGVLLTEWLRSHFTPLPGLPHWRQLVLVVECGGLLLVSLLPVGPLDWLANVIVSFVSAMQIESFRKFEGNPPPCALETCAAAQRSCIAACSFERNGQAVEPRIITLSSSSLCWALLWVACAPTCWLDARSCWPVSPCPSPFC